MYSNNDSLTNNLGDTLVHWIKKVREIKTYKTNGSDGNGHSSDQPTGWISVKITNRNRLEQKAN